MADTVAITGGSGFIGKACIKVLSEKGFNILRIGRNKSDEIYCDLSKPESVQSLHSIKSFNTFLHLGSYIGWNGGVLSDMYTSNICAPSPHSW